MGKAEKVHFIGVCGTAMGSVAAALRDRGFQVTGSDEGVYPPMSTFLAEKGVEIIEGYRAENVPRDVDLVVVGNAISRGNEEVEEVLNRKLRYVSLPEIIKEQFLRGKRNVVVSGTHGKTTTSSMAATATIGSGAAAGTTRFMAATAAIESGAAAATTRSMVAAAAIESGAAAVMTGSTAAMVTTASGAVVATIRSMATAETIGFGAVAATTP